MNMITNALLREHVENTGGQHHSGTWKKCTLCSLEIKKHLKDAESSHLLELMRLAIAMAKNHGKAQVYWVQDFKQHWVRHDQEEKTIIDDHSVICVFRAER